MDSIGLTEILLIASACFVAVIAAFWLLSRLSNTSGKPAFQGFEGTQSTAFLLEGENLVDATVSAYGLLGPAKPGQTHWARIREIMLPRFPSFPDLPDTAEKTGEIATVAHGNDQGRLLIQWWDGIIRVELIENDAAMPDGQHKLIMLQQEVKTLRDAVQGTPYPVWQTNTLGHTTWTNTAYNNLMITVSEDADPDQKDPIELFDLNCVEGVELTRSRTALNTNNTEKQHWYDVSTVRFDDKCMNYAIDVNAVVNAEIAQRNFVQTLTKTFAHLSIGLAIFDRNRQLALFNPALIDLTALPADFLSGRPNLLSFFDRLRDNRTMPEPKNYSSWRKQIADLVAAASDGRYFETWSLESGLTYRVSGRPHPDGAIAFLFEDISAEISLTQRFRAQLKLGQSVLDNVDQAIAVFSPDGVLTLSNSAYQSLWDIDPESSFAAVTIADTIQHWRSKCASPADWERLRKFVEEYGTHSDRKTCVKMHDGKQLDCWVSHLTGGITCIKFSGVTITQGDKIPAETA